MVYFSLVLFMKTTKLECWFVSQPQLEWIFSPESLSD